MRFSGYDPAEPWIYPLGGWFNIHLWARVIEVEIDLNPVNWRLSRCSDYDGFIMLAGPFRFFIASSAGYYAWMVENRRLRDSCVEREREQ